MKNFSIKLGFVPTRRLVFDKEEDLTNLAKKRDLLCCVTYTYFGYPMVKHAREIIEKGEICKIRMVMGEYLQEWLAMLVEKKEGNKQASWQLTPNILEILIV